MMDEIQNRIIPDKKVVMRCDTIKPAIFSYLPKGYYYKMYDDGDERYWVEIATAVGDFETKEQALEYFETEYLTDKTQLRKRCVIVLDKESTPVASCIAWHDTKEDQIEASLQWMTVLPEYHDLGIEKALLSKALEIYHVFGESSVYLHVHPRNHKDIESYLEMGFYIVEE